MSELNDSRPAQQWLEMYRQNRRNTSKLKVQENSSAEGAEIALQLRELLTELRKFTQTLRGSTRNNG